MRLLLIVSLLVNCALVSSMAFLLSRKPVPIAPAEDKPIPGKTLPAPATSPGTAALKKPTAADPLTPAPTIHWENVESSDYKEYIANLRSIGCPERTIKDIIKADVNKLYAAKLKEQLGVSKKREYWKAPEIFNADGEAMKKMQERQKIITALQKEKQEVLKTLLGSHATSIKDLYDGFEMNDVNGTDLDFLPPAKQSKIQQIQMKQQQAMMKLMTAGGGFGAGFDPDDQKELQKLQKDTEDEIKALLTSQELVDWEVRVSQTANTVRHQLRDFDPNEQEYLTIFRLRKPFDEKYNQMDFQDQELMKRRQEEEIQIKEQIKTALGGQRYEDYERVTDGNYQMMSQSLGTQHKMDKQEIAKLWRIQKAVNEGIEKAQRDSNLQGEDRKQVLETLVVEMENSIKQSVGDEKWKQLRKDPQSYWLKQPRRRAGLGNEIPE